jgi:hypothetical protein
MQDLPVSYKLDVLRHQLAVHANQVAWEGLRHKLLLNSDGFNDDVTHTLLRHLVVHHTAGQEKKGVSSQMLTDLNWFLAELQYGYADEGAATGES